MTHAVGEVGWAVTATPAADEGLRMRWAFSLIAAVLVGGWLLSAAPMLLQDPDNWWHVRVGLDLLSNGALPHVDSYSHTFAGQPWIAKEWLAQVLLALAFRAADWNGVALLTIATLALTVFLLVWHLGASLKPLTAVALALVATVGTAPIFSARPITLTLPIIVVWTAHLFAAAREERMPPLWLLPLFCLWANLHAAFTFGLAIAFFAGLYLLERTRLSQPKLLLQWFGFGLLCLLAGVVHPYGAKALLATFTVTHGNEAVGLIGEWQPFSASTYHFQTGALLGAVFGLLAVGLRVGWAKALFIVCVLYLFLAHLRFVYLPFLLIPIALAPELAARFPQISARHWAVAPRDGLEQLFAARFWAVTGTLAGLAVVVATAFAGLAATKPSEKTSAEGALAFARAENLNGPVLNSYDFGGTLIFHGIKTFIDGRTDQLFLDGFMLRDYEAGLTAGKPILIEQIETHDIAWALLTKDDPRIPFFDELPGWRPAYADDHAVIYTRGE